MVEFLLFREIVLFAGLLIASYADLKSGIIPDKLNYSLIAIGILFNLFDFNLWHFVIPIAVFAFFVLLYYLGKIGGGDVKLFTATALLVPFFEGQPFIVIALFYSAIVSILFLSVYYSLKYVRLYGFNFQENRSGLIQAGALLVFIAVYAFALQVYHFLTIELIIAFFIPLLFGALFIAFQNGIKKHFFLSHVKLENLEEDEIVAREFLSESIVKELHFSTKGIITDADKEKLRSLNVAEVPVYRSLPPFAPFFLMGCVLSILHPFILLGLFAFNFAQ